MVFITTFCRQFNIQFMECHGGRNEKLEAMPQLKFLRNFSHSLTLLGKRLHYKDGHVNKCHN